MYKGSMLPFVTVGDGGVRSATPGGTVFGAAPASQPVVDAEETEVSQKNGSVYKALTSCPSIQSWLMPMFWQLGAVVPQSFCRLLITEPDSVWFVDGSGSGAVATGAPGGAVAVRL